MRAVIVIIGAGFSGTVLAVNLLLRQDGKPADIVLIERGPAMNRGVAYAARHVPYLLNVPAGRLSADSSHAQQFLDFARVRVPEAGPEDFLPRSLYGDYLEDLLNRAESGAAPVRRLQRIHDEVMELTRVGAGIEVRFAQREPLRADEVVLAVGNPPASVLPCLDSLRGHAAIRENPWELPQDLRADHSVLIIGNGLTMADVALAMSRDPQRIPALHTLSRRGLVPQVQTTFAPSPACGKGEELLVAAHSIRSLLKASRSVARRVERAGGDWREVVTLIRHLAPQIWRQLPSDEQARFVRHVQAQWDTHRHRLPPAVAQRLDELKSSGKLRVNAGRVLRIEAEGERLRVLWQRRGKREASSLAVDMIVNATGPDYVLKRTREPLLRALLDQGLIAPDDLGLGIRTDGRGACLDAHGKVTARIYYLGPMLRADHWEATAATELRDHAEKLAQRIAV